MWIVIAIVYWIIGMAFYTAQTAALESKTSIVITMIATIGWPYTLLNTIFYLLYLKIIKLKIEILEKK